MLRWLINTEIKGALETVCIIRFPVSRAVRINFKKTLQDHVLLIQPLKLTILIVIEQNLMC